MPLFASLLSINTQHETSWDTYVNSGNPTANYHSQSSLKANRNIARSGSNNDRIILSFDLSDLTNRSITSATLTMKTVSGFGFGSASVPLNIYKLTTSNIVFDQVTWNLASIAAASAFNGGDGAFDAGTTAVINGSTAASTVCTSADLTDVLSGSEGSSKVYLLIKADESGGGTFGKAFIGHDEDDSSVVADLPTLSITSTIDHRNVYNKHEMTKFMNKSVGVKGKASVPSIG